MIKYFISFIIICVKLLLKVRLQKLVMLAKDWWIRTERVVTEFEILYQHFCADDLHLHSRTPGPGPTGMQRRSATIWRHALVMLSHDLVSIADHESSTRPLLLWQLHCSVCNVMYIGFKKFFYVVRHLDSIVSYLPSGLHLGFFRAWPSLFLPSSFSSVFLMLSFVLASTSMLFWAIFLLPFVEHGRTMWVASVRSLL